MDPREVEPSSNDQSKVMGEWMVTIGDLPEFMFRFKFLVFLPSPSLTIIEL